MSINKKVKPETRHVYLNGMSPQQAIRYFKNMITQTPEPYKGFLRIEEYREDYGDPFSDGENGLRLVCYKQE